MDVDGDAANWTCAETHDFLHEAGLCRQNDSHDDSAPLVCAAFKDCAVEAVAEDDATYDDASLRVKCSSTSCDVSHPSWLGDGYCDDDQPCFNTAACGYDGGDCCRGTCAAAAGAAFACGAESKYVCRDPSAQGCGKDAGANLEVKGAAAGGGWGAALRLYSVFGASYVPVADVGADSSGETGLCLANGCYVVEAEADALFGREAEWSVSVKDASRGKRILASGGAPDVCMFAVGLEAGSSQYCPSTCASDFFVGESSCDFSELHLMVLRDAGFNGWAGVQYSVHAHDVGDVRGLEVSHGTLAFGHMNVHGICMRDSGCYSVTLAQGWWEDEVSWTLGRVGVGAVAKGGAPAECDFSVGRGSSCPNTCLAAAQDEDCTHFKVELYDLSGQGWAHSKYTIAGEGIEETGTLSFGYQAEDAVCFLDGCYTFDVSNFKTGTSWAFGSEASGLLFSGDTAVDRCTFAVGRVENCAVTCEPSGGITKPPTPAAVCANGERNAVVRLNDARGDGWDGSFFTLFDDSKPSDGGEQDEEGFAHETLISGAYGEYSYCLAPGCYRVQVDSGKFHEEVSWELADETDPREPRVVVHGAAPEKCTFALGGASCPNVGCETRGKGDWQSEDDDFWVDDLYYGGGGDYDDDGGTRRCTGGEPCDFTQLVSGWYAAGSMQVCLGHRIAAQDGAYSPFDQKLWENKPALCLGTYDFLELDAFEECASQLEASSAPVWSDQRGRMAQKCMKMLLSAAPDRSEGDESQDELVMRIATMVYYYGNDGFCDCTRQGDGAPACSDFLDLGAVVRESLEACHALDQVDCAYFGQYLKTCQQTLPQKFGRIDLQDARQCDYVEEEGCGGLAVPAVRRWDCLFDSNQEMAQEQKDFIAQVYENCVRADEDDHETPEPQDDDDAPLKPSKRKRTPPPPGPNVGAIVGSLLAVLAVGAVGGWFLNKRGMLPFSRAPASSRAAAQSTELGYAFAPLHEQEHEPARGF